MCELLGMSFNIPVRCSFSFREFRHRGKKNPDGWGLAFYPDKSCQAFKEEFSAFERGGPLDMTLSGFVANYRRMKSKTFIGHVRRSSGTPVSHMNTHPFSRELDGRDFLFAHNGFFTGEGDDDDLKNYLEAPTRFKPVGKTDSELIFCHLLDGFAENLSNDAEGSLRYDWLIERLREANEHEKLNCIFSDGESLYCYRDKDEYKDLLFLQRSPPYQGSVRLIDDDWEIDMQTEKDAGEAGYIIATNALTNESWISFIPGELIIFRKGVMTFSNKRPASSSISAAGACGLSDAEISVLREIRSSERSMKLDVLRRAVGNTCADDAVGSLLSKKFIIQTTRTKKLGPRNDDAEFFTVGERRSEIDRILASPCSSNLDSSPSHQSAN